MLYPVYVCPGNETVPHSLYIPDIPGCVGTLDDWKKLPHAIQEAVELHFEGEDLEIPLRPAWKPIPAVPATLAACG